MFVLITGGDRLPARYVEREFAGEDIVTLHSGPDATVRCDAAAAVKPDFGDRRFDIVVHCMQAAGGEAPDDFTGRLLSALEGHAPRQMILISTHEVYSLDAGEGISEQTAPAPSSETGRRALRAEDMAGEWCRARGVMLTVLRPAMMFGTGVDGEAAEMFRDVISGRYVHIRGNEARLSVVTALDTARCAKALVGHEGVFNVADGADPRWIDLAEAMSANAGARKRMTHLTGSWAASIRKMFGWIPPVGHALDRRTLERRATSRTLSAAAVIEASGLKFHNTVDVIAREDSSYPYDER